MSYTVLRVVNCKICFMQRSGMFSATINEETYSNDSREHCFSVARVNHGLCVELPATVGSGSNGTRPPPPPPNCSHDLAESSLDEEQLQAAIERTDRFVAEMQLRRQRRCAPST